MRLTSSVASRRVLAVAVAVGTAGAVAAAPASAATIAVPSSTCPTPSTTLSTDYAAIGSTVTVTGIGFSGCKPRTGSTVPTATLPVRIVLADSSTDDLADVKVVTTAQTAADGSFTATFTVPRLTTGPSGDVYVLATSADPATKLKYLGLKELNVLGAARPVPTTSLKGARGLYGTGKTFRPVLGLASSPTDQVCMTASTRCVVATSYLVAKGDHLMAITRKLAADTVSTVLEDDSSGVTISKAAIARETKALYKANRKTIGANPNRLKAGQVLKLPKGDELLLVVAR